MKQLLVLAGALVTGLAFGVALDATNHGRLGGGALEVLVGTLAGAVNASTWPRLRRRSDPLHGAVLGGLATFVLMRAPFGWLDLGGLGAGPPGELAYIVLPAASVLAVSGAIRPRGASRAALQAPERARGPSPRT